MIMEAIYLENSGNLLKYFVCCIGDDDDNYHFKEIKEIARGAFSSSEFAVHFFFDDVLTTVKEKAFKDCEDLKFFCCGEADEDKATGNIKGVDIYEATEFYIETSAFSGCEKLHTVIFPKCKGLLAIEKNAFEECSSLRTVVALATNIKFTENPFKDCPKDLLTFVCYEKYEVEQFARENGYKYIYVQ